ncbi:competence type IV pilus assembly protein ComGB [Bacillus kexueae]|uniref:competence type IV pilus assembly protein ComGB n=1 Tax=Aeribacillus kexueae TaxID=2078952 RepID=UPI001FAF2D0E|nr:competence type IV pilus assembly protein ComGB [Bacillus kexueae]
MKKNRWKLHDQSQFLKKLSDLLSQGYSLNEAISFTMLHLPNALKRDASYCVELLARGESFRIALEDLGFHRNVLSFLFFAENYGDIKTALMESSRLLTIQVEQTEKVKQVLRYPLFLLLFMGFNLYAVELVIAPQFEAMYQSMSTQASFTTFLLLSVFDLVFFGFLVFVLVCIIVTFYYFFFFRKLSPHSQLNVIIRVPFIRKLFSLYNSYYFSFQMSFLLKGGLSIYESLTLFQQQPMLPLYKHEANHMIEQLADGKKFSDILRESQLFENEIADVTYHGQAISKLDRELYTYSQLVLSRLEQSILKWTRYIQPIAFMIIGILVLIVYLSIMLPMYQMIQTI